MNKKTECEKYKKECEKKLKKEMKIFKIIGAIIFGLFFLLWAISIMEVLNLNKYLDKKFIDNSFLPFISIILFIYLGVYLFYFRKIKKSFIIIFIFIAIAIILFIISIVLRKKFLSRFNSLEKHEDKYLFDYDTITYGYLYFGYYIFLILFGFIGSFGIPSNIKINTRV